MPAPAHTVRDGPEFSRVVRVPRDIRHAWVEAFQATRGECAGLAHRFSLVALEYLRAKAEMTPRSGRDGVNASVSFQGGVIQSCVLTLDPVCARIEGRFEITFSRRHIEGGVTGTGFAAVDNFGDEPRPLIGDSVDIGELVAEHLALALDPYPRKAGAKLTGADPAPTASRSDGPFAALAALTRRES